MITPRDDSRDTGNRIRAMLEVVMSLCPVAVGQEQEECLDRMNKGVHEALLGIKAYVRLRNNMQK